MARISRSNPGMGGVRILRRPARFTLPLPGRTVKASDGVLSGFAANVLHQVVNDATLGLAAGFLTYRFLLAVTKCFLPSPLINKVK